MPFRTVLGGAIAVGAIVLITGCGPGGTPGGSSSHSVAASASRSAPAKHSVPRLTRQQMQDALLTVDDLTAGFAVYAENDRVHLVSATSSECASLYRKEYDNQPKSSVLERDFTDDSDQIYVADALQLAPPGKGTAMLSDMRKLTEDCQRFTVAGSDGAQETMTLRHESYPSVGDESLGVRIEQSQDGVTVTGHGVVFRIGDNVSFVYFLDAQTDPGVQELRFYAEPAEKKLRKAVDAA